METVYRVIYTGYDDQSWDDFNTKEEAIERAEDIWEENNHQGSVLVVETRISDGGEDYDIVFEKSDEFEDKLAGDEPEGFEDNEAPVLDEPEEIKGEEDFEESLKEAEGEEEKKEYDFDEDSAYNDRDYDEEEYRPEEEIADDEFEAPEDPFADDDYTKGEIEKVYPEEASNEETIWVYQFPEEFNLRRVIDDAKNFNLKEVPSEGDDDDICFAGKYSDLKAFSASYQYIMNADYLVPEQWFSGERLAY